jgi:hypothetical protein
MNELHRVLADDGVLHVLSPHWQSVTAVADPTHVKYLDVQTFKWFCGPHGGAEVWHPLHAGYDGASVFADLRPMRRGEPLPRAGAIGPLLRLTRVAGTGPRRTPPARQPSTTTPRYVSIAGEDVQARAVFVARPGFIRRR